MHSNILEEVSKTRSRTQYPIGIGAIISSHQLLTGAIKYGFSEVYLDQSSIILISANRKYSHVCSNEIIYINFKDYIKRLEVNNIILIGTRITLKVLQILKECVKAIVITDGLLSSHMSVSLPEAQSIQIPVHLKSEEKTDILEAIHLQCDFIIYPCPKNISALEYAKSIQMFNFRKPLMFGQINSQEKEIQKLDISSLINSYDGIWISNSNNCSINIYTISQLIKLQKFAICSSYIDKGKLRINQNENESINKYLLITTNCVIFSEHYKEINIKQFLKANYVDLNKSILQNYNIFIERNVFNMQYQYYRKIILLSMKFKTSCILIANDSNKSIKFLSQNRPLMPIIACFSSETFFNQSSIYGNVYPYFQIKTESNWEAVIRKQLNSLVLFGQRLGFIKKTSPFLFCFSSDCKNTECDSYRILFIDKFH